MIDAIDAHFIYAEGCWEGSSFVPRREERERKKSKYHIDSNYLISPLKVVHRLHTQITRACLAQVQWAAWAATVGSTRR